MIIFLGMKKADFKIETVDIVNGDNEATIFPFTEGATYHFTLSKELLRNRAEYIDGIFCEWTEAVTDEQVAISVRQLTLRNNGLNLDGKTVNQRLQSFLTLLFDNDGHLTLRITKVIEREWTKPNGEPGMRKYLKFEII